MASVVEELQNLQLQLIDPGWAETIYDAEFLEFSNFPPEYETVLEYIDVGSTLLSTITAIDRWLRPGVEAAEERTWTMLSQLIPHKRLVALLAYYINYGCSNIQDSDHRTYAVLASRVYYKLLSIPGRGAYDIYHSQLFANTLACLGIPKAMAEEENFYNARDLTNEINSVVKELRFLVVDLKATVKILRLTPNDLNFEEMLSTLITVATGEISGRLHVGK